MSKPTPEQETLTFLNSVIADLADFDDHIVNISTQGSMALGTYVGDNPDIDIFVDTTDPQALFNYYKKEKFGYEKMGHGLLIWCTPSTSQRRPTDVVFVDRRNTEVQTMDHTEYYLRILNDDMRAEIKKLKFIMKTLNLYGAETGGITGICCTRLIETLDTADEAIAWLVQRLTAQDHLHIEDPCKFGRNLFASVRAFKLPWFKSRLTYYNEYKKLKPVLGKFEGYRRTYVVGYDEMQPIDLQFQATAKTFRNIINQVMQETRWWHTTIEYDIYKDTYGFIIGFSVYPDILTETITENIPLEYIADGAKNLLLKKGATIDHMRSWLTYVRKRPYPSCDNRVTKLLKRQMS